MHSKTQTRTRKLDTRTGINKHERTQQAGRQGRNTRRTWEQVRETKPQDITGIREQERAGDTEHENKQTWNHGRPNMEDAKGRT